MITRTQLEDREQRELAPYAMKSAASRGRKYPEDEHPCRTAYQRDRDRIVHSSAFRRLEYKTQVFVNHEGDYYRTRLTHTMEVVQVARSVARALNLNEDLTEAVALAHDLGHTPFGHSGEEALRDLMASHGGFEHNAQSLRIIDILEDRYPDFPGLNLTYELRESILKHRSRFDHPVSQEFHPEEGALLEAQVVDACDAIAYNNHDIDDGIKSGYLTIEDLLEVPFFADAWNGVNERYLGLNRRVALRQTVRSLINQSVGDLIRASERALTEHRIDSLAAVRACREPLIRFSPDSRAQRDRLGDFLFQRLYRHFRVARMAEKAKRFVTELFREYVRYGPQLPPRYQKAADRDGIERAVCDYIAGMTDRYAQEEYRRLFHPFERT
ncbi:MAG: deoxyguanosinetriphosphate triphosphohydrolase [Planctomycetes bacterium]|nr:deoxyguanosinetriphosphate triphosphohydrolase [Planctomycetota bacterium]